MSVVLTSLLHKSNIVANIVQENIVFKICFPLKFVDILNQRQNDEKGLE